MHGTQDMKNIPTNSSATNTGACSIITSSKSQMVSTDQRFAPDCLTYLHTTTEQKTALGKSSVPRQLDSPVPIALRKGSWHVKQGTPQDVFREVNS